MKYVFPNVRRHPLKAITTRPDVENRRSMTCIVTEGGGLQVLPEGETTMQGARSTQSHIRNTIRSVVRNRISN
jgi:hypothetical protein